MEIFRNPHFDFLGRTKLWVAISLALLVASLTIIATKGLRYGVEFSGGTQLVAKFRSTPSVDKIRAAVTTVDPNAVIQAYDDPSKNQVLIRLAQAEGEGEITALAQSVLAQLSSSYADNPVVESSSEVVGPIVGGELRKKAIQLTLWGLLFQLVYIGFRFKGFAWGSAASIAVFHDVIITLGVLCLFGYEITLNVIAALLTLVGYSVNDTIVVFDRVRENLKQMRKEGLAKVINDSINQTLSRTIITSGATFLTVLGLFLFGGAVLRGFAFAVLVGIVFGTYSSIYIASPIVVWWTNFRQKRQGA